MRKLFVLATLTIFTFYLAFPGLTYGEEEICACKQKEHGQLRIVEDPSQCLDSEIPIYLSGRRAPIEIPSLSGTWKAMMEIVANEALNIPGFFPWVSKEFEVKIVQEENSKKFPNVRFFKATATGPGWPYGEGPAGPIAGIIINNEVHMTPGGGTIIVAKFVPGNPPKFEGYLHHVYEHEGGADDAYNPHTGYFTMEKVVE